MREQAFLLGVAVEAGDGAQAAGNGCPRSAPGLELSSVGLDVRSSYVEQVQLVCLAEGDELPQVECVGVPREAAVAAEEPGEREVFGIRTVRVVEDDGGR